MAHIANPNRKLLCIRNPKHGDLFRDTVYYVGGNIFAERLHKDKTQEVVLLDKKQDELTAMINYSE